VLLDRLREILDVDWNAHTPKDTTATMCRFEPSRFE
jgi:hypothetical protein